MGETGTFEKRRIIDLSTPISGDTRVVPELPGLKMEKVLNFEEHGWDVSKVSFVAHMAATHMDAPSHHVKGGHPIDEFPVSKFLGSAVMVDVCGKDKIEPDCLGDVDIRKDDIVLFHTEYMKNSGREDFFEKLPDVTVPTAEALVEKGIKMVGIDSPGIDADPHATHEVFMKADIPILEGLINLDKIEGERFEIVALPLKLKGLDGSLCRVIAIV